MTDQKTTPASEVTMENEPEGKMKDAYVTKWVCDNCCYRFSLSVPRGKLRPQEVECPNCGCVKHIVRFTSMSDDYSLQSLLNSGGTDLECRKALRARLLAAEKMAKALIDALHNEALRKGTINKIEEALAAYRDAGEGR